MTFAATLPVLGSKADLAEVVRACLAKHLGGLIWDTRALRFHTISSMWESRTLAFHAEALGDVLLPCLLVPSVRSGQRLLRGCWMLDALMVCAEDVFQGEGVF